MSFFRAAAFGAPAISGSRAAKNAGTPDGAPASHSAATGSAHGRSPRPAVKGPVCSTTPALNRSPSRSRRNLRPAAASRALERQRQLQLHTEQVGRGRGALAVAEGDRLDPTLVLASAWALTMVGGGVLFGPRRRPSPQWAQGHRPASRDLGVR